MKVFLPLLGEKLWKPDGEIVRKCLRGHICFGASIAFAFIARSCSFLEVLKVSSCWKSGPTSDAAVLPAALLSTQYFYLRPAPLARRTAGPTITLSPVRDPGSIINMSMC